MRIKPYHLVSSVALTGLLLVCLPARLVALELVYAYAADLPAKPVWRGQQVEFSVVVVMKDRPQGSPRFRLPDTPGGALLEISGFPVFGREDRDGVSYNAWRYDFAYYPQRPGVHQIPAVGVRVSQPDGEGSWRSVSVECQPFEIEVRSPPGSEGLRGLVASTRFKAIERWEPEEIEPRVGDALTRTIVRHADAILGMGFPPLDLNAGDGVGNYPNPPQLKDRIYRGTVSGERTDTFTYVFEREGPVTLPAVTLRWFDLNEESIQDIEFLPRTFVVKPNQDFTDQEVVNVMPVSRPPVSWKRFVGGLLATVALALLVFGRRWSVAALLRRLSTKKRASEGYAFHQLLKTCRGGDAPALLNSLHCWLPRLYQRSRPVLIADFLSDVDDAKLTKEIRLLQRHLYGARREGSLETPKWSSSNLCHVLLQARRRLQSKTPPNARPENELRSLNPVD